MGERITIIKDEQRYLVNSKPTGQPVTICKDRKNIIRIRRILSGQPI